MHVMVTVNLLTC